MHRFLRGTSRLFAELKRRKVYQVAIVYLVAAFVGLQVLDLLVPDTTLPDWAPGLFIALVILGFPVALVLAWAFELTPEGVRRERPAKEQPAQDAARSGSIPKPAPDKQSPATGPGVERSIAVLPFETLGARKASAFTDAIHVGVLTRLSSISDLRVISRTSVQRYRKSDKALPEIGIELGVGWILGGEVQEVAEQVEVNARLMDAVHDRQVWAEHYRRDLTAGNIFDIQGEITRRISDSLKARLTRKEAREIDRAPTTDLDAYRRYAQGRGWLDERTEDGMRRAADFFRHAVAHDPTYALAWVGLADSLTLLHDYAHEHPDSVLPEAERAVRKALELEPDLAEAHASLGLLHGTNRNGPDALRELALATELRPGYAEAHNWLSWLSLLVGDADRAHKASARAVDLDPLAPEPLTNLAWSQLALGNAVDALATIRRERALGSAWTTGPLGEGVVLYHLGRHEEAIEVLDGLSAEWAGVGAEVTLALACLASGARDRAVELEQGFRETADYFASATVLAGLGEIEPAFSQLERVRNWGYWDAMAIHHYYGEVLGPLRADSRWGDIVARLNRSWGL